MNLAYIFFKNIYFDLAKESGQVSDSAVHGSLNKLFC